MHERRRGSDEGEVRGAEGAARPTGRPVSPHDGLSPLHQEVLALQRTAGNRAATEYVRGARGRLNGAGREPGGTWSRDAGRAPAGIVQRAPAPDADGGEEQSTKPRASSGQVRCKVTVDDGAPGKPISLRLRLSPSDLKVFLPDMGLANRAYPGTPTERAAEPENREQFELKDPTLSLSLGTGKLTGSATLLLPSGHRFSDPTPIELEVRTTEPVPSALLPRPEGDELSLPPLDVSASALAGAMQVDASVVLSVRTDRVLAVVQRHLAPLIPHAIEVGSPVLARVQELLGELAAGEIGYEHAAEQLLDTIETQRAKIDRERVVGQVVAMLEELKAEVTHPGFEVSGTTKALWFVPVGKGAAGAETTCTEGAPLPGGPPVPMWYWAYGLMMVPAGGRYSTPRPAAGATAGKFGTQSGASASAAAVPGLDPAAISAGGSPAEPSQWLEWIPVDFQAQASVVGRVGPGLDVGFRLEAVVPATSLVGKGDEEVTFDDVRKAVTEPEGARTPKGAYVLGTLYGRF